jgi:hypothetical protein
VRRRRRRRPRLQGEAGEGAGERERWWRREADVQRVSAAGSRPRPAAASPLMAAEWGPSPSAPALPPSPLPALSLPSLALPLLLGPLARTTTVLREPNMLWTEPMTCSRGAREVGPCGGGRPRAASGGTAGTAAQCNGPPPLTPESPAMCPPPGRPRSGRAPASTFDPGAAGAAAARAAGRRPGRGGGEGARWWDGEQADGRAGVAHRASTTSGRGQERSRKQRPRAGSRTHDKEAGRASATPPCRPPWG